MTDESIDTLYKVCKELFVLLVISLLVIELMCGFTVSFIAAIVAFVCTLVILSPIIITFKIVSSLENIEYAICYNKADKDVDELHYDEAKDDKPIEL